MDERAALKTSEAAKIIGVNKRTMDNWRSLGMGPSYIKPTARTVRYLMADLLAYRNAKRVTPVNG